MRSNTETFEPFDDGTVIKVTYNQLLDPFRIASRMPDGMVERVKEENMADRDCAYLAWVVDEFSNMELFEMLLEDSEFSDKQVSYILKLILDTVSGQEVKPWDEFAPEDTSFISNGGLNIR